MRVMLWGVFLGAVGARIGAASTTWGMAKATVAIRAQEWHAGMRYCLHVWFSTSAGWHTQDEGVATGFAVAPPALAMFASTFGCLLRVQNAKV